MRQSKAETRYAETGALFVDYVDETRHLAAASSPSLQDRAAVMLQNRIDGGAHALETDADAVISKVVDLAIARADNRPPPIYVAGLGGSGSHWLTGMLDEVLPVINLEEAPIPAGLDSKLESLPAQDQGFVIDCLHLSYASASQADITFADLTEARFLHSAVRVIEPRHKAWDPECFVIYLLRDPRDQVACFAFRKRPFRQRHYPAASDEQYLVGCATNNAQNYSETRRSPVRPDFVCRYEELKASTPDVLSRLAAALGNPIGEDVAVHAARRHDASLMRSGALSHKGNLFPTESRGWREETSERQKLILHSLLTEVVTDARYPADDCLGGPLATPTSRGARRLRFPEGERLGTLFTRGDREQREGTWTRLAEACGEVSAPPDVALKLRVHEQAPAESIRSLRGLPADGLDSLCMAGNASLDDELLSICAASLRDLRELDLARTAVTDGCIDALASLPHLAGVNLFEANLTPGGASTLRHKLRRSTTIGR
jgi:Sulfotransferase domain